MFAILYLMCYNLNTFNERCDSMAALTTKERLVYDYIERSINENGYPPTVRDICANTGIIRSHHTIPSIYHGAASSLNISKMKTPEIKKSLTELVSLNRKYKHKKPNSLLT